MAEVVEAGESPAPAPERRKEFDAFLSYAHRNQEATAAIQKGLHQIGRRIGQLRALRVFRDTTNLEANPDLWAKILDGLDGSRFMIVMLSPQAATSHWVGEEVKHWLERHGHEGLMMVLVEGQLHWDEKTERFDPELSDAAPAPLTSRGRCHLSLSTSTSVPTHPGTSGPRSSATKSRRWPPRFTASLKTS